LSKNNSKKVKNNFKSAKMVQNSMFARLISILLPKSAQKWTHWFSLTEKSGTTYHFTTKRVTPYPCLPNLFVFPFLPYPTVLCSITYYYFQKCNAFIKKRNIFLQCVCVWVIGPKCHPLILDLLIKDWAKHYYFAVYNRGSGRMARRKQIW
jgi:hypothetical protein